MTIEEIYSRGFEKEVVYQTSRSSGPGGQHVNKTESKVELKFNINESALLSDLEKERMKIKLKNRINSEGFLHLYSQLSRSQLANKEEVFKQFIELIFQALFIQKIRFKTKPTYSSKEKRIDSKKRNSLIKTLRSKNF